MVRDIFNTLRYRLRRGDVLTWLVAVNVAVYVAVAATWLCSRHAEAALLSWLGVSAVPSDYYRHAWTVLTYMFTQSDFLHMLFNVLWLWWFGQTLLYTLTPRHLAWIYVTGGLAGALGYLTPLLLGSNPFHSTLLVGSSASVLCVMTVAAFRSPNVRYNLFLIGRVKLKWLAVASIVLLFFGFGGMSGAQGAHIGGVAWGAVMGLLYINGTDPLRRVLYPENIFGSLTERHRQRKAARAFRRAGANREHLDRLLDKINTSGYDSLTRSERQQLQTLSKRLNKDN